MDMLMKKFRRGRLKLIKQFIVGKTAFDLVHRQGKARFFRSADGKVRAIVNADTDEEALKILQDELQSIKNSEAVQEVEGDVKNILSGTQRNSKLR